MIKTYGFNRTRQGDQAKCTKKIFQIKPQKKRIGNIISPFQTSDSIGSSEVIKDD
jgi:hypothetical protein